MPKLAALLDNAEEDVLAYMGCPAQHRAKIHSTNPIELRIPTQGGQLFRFDGGHRSNLMAATIPI